MTRVRTFMDARQIALLSVCTALLLSMHVAFADSSDISWKVTMKQNSTNANSTIFWPAEIQAMQGETIKWTNNDTIDHTITSGVPNRLNYAGKLFDSGVLKPGQTFTLKVPKGVWSAYYYFDRNHPWVTGKIDVGVAYLGKSSVFTITTDKKTYSTNDVIHISGNVTDASQIMPLTFQIFDSQRNMVFSGNTNLLPNHGFFYKLPASDSVFKTSGSYKIKAFYGFPATVTDSNFYFNKSTSDITRTISPASTIPYWVSEEWGGFWHALFLGLVGFKS